MRQHPTHYDEAIYKRIDRIEYDVPTDSDANHVFMSKFRNYRKRRTRTLLVIFMCFLLGSLFVVGYIPALGDKRLMFAFAAAFWAMGSFEAIAMLLYFNLRPKGIRRGILLATLEPFKKEVAVKLDRGEIVACALEDDAADCLMVGSKVLLLKYGKYYEVVPYFKREEMST